MRTLASPVSRIFPIPHPFPSLPASQLPIQWIVSTPLASILLLLPPYFPATLHLWQLSTHIKCPNFATCNMCGELNLVNRKVKPTQAEGFTQLRIGWSGQAAGGRITKMSSKNSFGDLLCELLVVIHFADIITQRHVRSKQQPGEYFASELCHTEPGCTASVGSPT